MQHKRRLASKISVTVLIAIALFGGPTWAGTKYKVLHGFKGAADGGGVFAGIIPDAQGNIYGVTTGGGANSQGTLFELSSYGGHWTHKILHSFSLHSDGDLPMGTLAVSNGSLFGTTLTGGPNDAGTIFELSPGGSPSSDWSFVVIEAAGSNSGLTISSAGDLFGADGEVFDLSPGSGGWSLEVPHIFCSWKECSDGQGALAPPVFDAAGNLYGTTKFGGNYPQDYGVVYQVEPLGNGKWKYGVLHRFSGGDGEYPYSGVVIDSSGTLYGTTLQGGGGSGVIYKISPQANGHWKETVLWDFPNASKNGGAPSGGLVFDQSGNLYGTTSGGGDPTCSCGVVFKLAPQKNGKWKYTVLHRYTGKDGWSPQASMTFDKDYKHLYGTTTEGGPGGYGVVFEITP
jgi:uncharacterized repeat protein (TIGR03803 family)